jgi:hypothetical protein
MKRWVPWSLVLAASVSMAEEPPISLSPSVHLSAAVGTSSAKEGSLAVGHHDPTREDGTVQGVEVGVSLRTRAHLEGFATYTFHYGMEEEWEDELEEAFLKLVDLPGGLEIRGGRVLSRFGVHNTRHLHAWDRVDMPLVLGRFLGDDGLILDGGDVTWSRRGIATTFGVVIGYGEAKTHDHGSHGSEGDGDHEHEEHGLEEARGHGGHDHDEGRFADDVWTSRAFARWSADDFHRYEAGLSLASGENGTGGETTIIGADFTRVWRERGLESGGRQLVWETEALVRRVEAAEHEEHGGHEDQEHGAEESSHDGGHHAEHGHEDHAGSTPAFHEYGFETSWTATLSDRLDLGAHAGWVGGIGELDADERWRFSPVLTVRPSGSDALRLMLQVNYDILEESEETSVWAQVNLSFGGPEVR